MIDALRNFGGKKIGGLILIAVIVIAFGFGGFGGGFGNNNQNNIAKINKTNVTTEDFMNYLNESGISQTVIKENLDNNIIEELLSGLISTTLINLEIEDFNLSITELTILKKIKENKNFLDDNNVFQRTKYEKFLLTNNMSAPMFELQLKNRELQKQLFDFIGSGTITPDFLITDKFEQENKTINLEYFAMSKFYKSKEDYTDLDIQKFLEKNEDQLKREYIDFKYVTLNPKNLIGIEEFNQEFFDEIDRIENRISQGVDFEEIIENISVSVNKVEKFAPSSKTKINEEKIYSQRSSVIDLIENGDNFLLYSISNKYERGPDLSDQIIKNEILNLVYQRNNYEKNRNILEEIQTNAFDNNKFKEMGQYDIKNLTLNSINDINTFESNSVKILYTLPLNSFTLVNDKENKIYLVKIASSQKNNFKKTDENYINFIKNQNSNSKKIILQSYDQLLNNKYQVQLNQKTIDRVKNYFK